MYIRLMLQWPAVADARWPGRPCNVCLWCVQEGLEKKKRQMFVFFRIVLRRSQLVVPRYKMFNASVVTHPRNLRYPVIGLADRWHASHRVRASAICMMGPSMDVNSNANVHVHVNVNNLLAMCK